MPSKIFTLSTESGVPKYKQLINSLYLSIENGEVHIGDQLPSINAICKEFKLSRDTVLVAFNELKARGVISSVPGKGYYLESNITQLEHKIFLLFEEFNVFKEFLYNSFMESLNGLATVDIYFHHFNERVFKELIENNNGKYTSYVIMPAKFKNAYTVLKQLPQDKVYILDQTNTSLRKHYPAIYQNFENDIFKALTSGLDLLKKYKKVYLVYPGGKEPEGQMKGFKKFANQYDKEWQFEIITSLKGHVIQKSEVYIVPNDNDMVRLVKEANANQFKIGEELGIISYNDTPLKEVVADGITTISTDFKEMGELLAKMVLGGEKELIQNKSELIRRRSL
ncbi:GntR family transcriptional regulator [Ancylomarina sp. 16SWW S1-10-2]|uniref:GntR family transcriptional regulator n=1 Tax=Ancylomarina sp. 16SWW S1-10-2 TaxID=2499681 RepID=UPI0012AE02E9|nr:GntR family transcriptional regulator [Ancylomarina sp. 16SWW S1-10-2]MRT92004.1 GntR family transcriptional regulator [Ancylomarina sp. 16SWW S1-10-2]